MGNGMNKVLPGLYLGSFRDSKDMDQLTQNSITHILSIHDNAKPLLEEFSYKCIEAADCPEQDIAQYFKESIDFIHNCRGRNYRLKQDKFYVTRRRLKAFTRDVVNKGTCLVHCMAGISRSTAIVAAYIMTVTNLDWRDTLKAIKCSRSIANPNYGFQRQLQDFYNVQAAVERERLKMEQPNAEFNDEEYLKELLASSEDKNSSDEDSIPSALARHKTRPRENVPS